MKKVIIFSSAICLILLVGVVALFNILLNNSSKIEKYDLTYLESNTPRLIQDYMNERTLNAELLSCHILIQNNQVFAFFDYKPLDGNSVIHEMPVDVSERCLFYGYVKIGKSFNKYSIVDFDVSNHDTIIETNGASGSGTSRSQQYRYYGKILDNNVDKIEFYDDDILLGTYYVGDKDYYFIEFNSSLGNISRIFYDKENQLLYR